MEAAAEAAGDDVRVLGITVLTHLGAEDLEELALPGGAADRVLGWAAGAQRAGCAGVVCSPLELASLRERLGSGLLLVSPGIRFATSAEDDQRRVATPADALAAGADLMVIGRPLTQAADPEAALAALVAACR